MPTPRELIQARGVLGRAVTDQHFHRPLTMKPRCKKAQASDWIMREGKRDRTQPRRTSGTAYKINIRPGRTVVA